MLLDLVVFFFNYIHCSEYKLGLIELYMQTYFIYLIYEPPKLLFLHHLFDFSELRLSLAAEELLLNLVVVLLDNLIFFIIFDLENR